MRTFSIIPLAIAAALALSPALVQAQSSGSHAHAEAAPASAAIDVPVEAQAAVAVADAFGEALVAADFERVEALLDPGVIILESGGAERSRQEYLGHHARSDARFLAGSHSELKRRRARTHGDIAWIASESELHAQSDGKPMILLSTETMVLRHTADGWKIVHIHWSSRPKK